MEFLSGTGFAYGIAVLRDRCAVGSASPAGLGSAAVPSLRRSVAPAIKAAWWAAALLVLAQAARAQAVYPVLVQQVPPANLGRLSDLANAAASPWSVTVALLDTREPSLPVGLRVRLEGTRLSAQTLDPLRAPLVTLAPGAPVTLTAADLAAYLAPGNVSLRGGDAAEFFAAGAVLPEGAYTICVEVVSVQRAVGRPLGQSCVPILAQAYDPPAVVAPADGAAVLPVEPQFVTVAWQHVGPAPPGAEYELEVYEVDPARGLLSPDDVVRLTAPLLRVSVPAQLQYNLDLASPALTVGRRYVTRVRVTDPLGRAAIRNRGYSRPTIWTYGATVATGACAPPEDVRPTHTGQTDATLSWALPAPADAPLGYELTVTADGASASLSLSPDATAAEQYLPALARNTAYGYVLAARCAGGGLSAAVAGDFRTLPTVADNPAAGCDAAPAPVVVTAATAGLRPGQVVRYRGLGLTLTRITAGANTASVTGEGTLNVPWLEQGVIHVAYDGLVVTGAGDVSGGRLSPKRATATRFDPGAYAAVLGGGACGRDDPLASLDANGFTPGGLHYATGTTRDPRGFDRDGEHEGGRAVGGIPVDAYGFNQAGEFVSSDGTTARYDTAGCDREGFTREGWPCGTRSSQLDSVARDYATQFGPGVVRAGLAAGAAYVIEKTGLPPWVGAALRTLAGQDLDLLRAAVAAAYDAEVAHARDSVAQVRALFADRSEPDRLAAALGVDRALLFGEGDSLLLEGVRARYPGGFPEALPAAGRDTLVVGVERELRRRYRADTTLARQLTPRTQVLGGLGDQLGQDYLQALVRAAVEGLSGDDFKDFTAALTAGPTALRDFAARLIRREVVRQARLLAAGLSDLGDGGAQGPQGRGRAPGAWAAGAWAARGPAIGDWAVDDWAGTRWASPAPPVTPDYARALASADASAGWGSATAAAAPPSLRELLPPPSRHPLFGYQLPLRITKEVDGREYVVIVDDLELPTAPGAAPRMDAYAVLPVPGQPGQAFVFAADGIPVGPGGLDGGSATLKLASRASFGLGSLGTLALPHDDPAAVNAVEIDCEGFKSFRIAGDLAVCREHAVPVDPQTLEPTTNGEELTLRVSASGTSWPEFTFAVANRTGRPFVAPALAEVVFDLDALVIDYSETEDAAGFVLPRGYPAQPKRWRGVYASRVGARFVGPIEEEGGPVGFEVSDMLVDHRGLTLEATATGLVGLDEGTVGSWDTALDTVAIDLDRDTLVGMRLAGRVRLPVDEDRVLRLSGGYGVDERGRRTFSFGASLDGEALGWDVWAGELSLLPNSGIAFAKTPDGYLGTATLYGTLDLGTAATAFAIDDVSVRGFELYTEAPYFGLADQGGLSVDLAGASRSIGGFGLELRRLGFRKSESPDWNLGLDVSGRISLMGGGGGFSVGGDLGILGLVDQRTGDFDYRKLKVDGVDLDVDIPGVEVRGGLVWRDEADADPTYGRGFSGEVEARFRGLGAGVAAAATFGSVDGYRYWLVDAAYLPPEPIPLVAPFAANALGGGASYHMVPSGRPGSPAEGPKGPVQFGRSFTGITYTPERSADLGLRLALRTELMTSASALNGDLVLGVTFAGTGVRKVNFDGTLRMMQPPAAPGERPTGTPSVKAVANITYGHRAGPGQTPQLHAAMRTYVNAPTGGSLIRGTGGGGLVGDVTLHIDKRDFYVWVGTPLAPIGVDIADLATVSTYYDIGTRLPPTADLPGKRPGDKFDFQELLGVRQLQLNPDASGFAHGLDWNIGGSRSFGPFRIGLAAQAGYNLTISDGFPCGDQTPGIGGWYAVGNAYAGIGGDFGLRIPGWCCFTCPKTFDIASMKVMMAAQVEAPNPNFVTGTARFEGEVLGLWETSWTGRVSFGRRCGGARPEDSDSEWGLPKDLILSYYPTMNDSPVSVGGRPRASFALSEGDTIALLPPQRQEREVAFDRFGREVVPEDFQPAPVFAPALEFRTAIEVRDSTGALVGTQTFEGPHPYTTDRYWDPGTEASFMKDAKYDVTVRAWLERVGMRVYENFVDTLISGAFFEPSRRVYRPVPPYRTLPLDKIPQRYRPYLPPGFTTGGVYAEKGHRYEQTAHFSFETGGLPSFEFVHDLKPAAGQDSVPVWVEPTVELLYAQEKAIGTFGRREKVLLEMDTFVLVRAGDRDTVSADVVQPNWSDPHRFSLQPREFLDPETGYEVVVTGLLRRLKWYHNGEAVTEPFLFNGAEIRDTVVHAFTTEKLPRALAAENIEVTYPLPAQHNFYLGETDADCFVTLARSQEFLWRDTRFGEEPKRVPFRVAYFDDYTDELVHETTVTAIDVAQGAHRDHRRTTIRWPRPPRSLKPGHVYRVELIIGEDEVPGPGRGDGSSAAAADFNPFDIPLVSTAAVPQPVRGTIYSNRFRVSRYPTLAAKLAVLAGAPTSRESLRGVRTPDFPSGFADDDTWVYPRGGERCANRLVPPNFYRVDRPEERWLGDLLVRDATALVEGFDEYEVNGYGDIGPLLYDPTLYGGAPPEGKKMLGRHRVAFAGVGDVNGLPQFPWADNALVQRAPALVLREGQGPDPDLPASSTAEMQAAATPMSNVSVAAPASGGVTIAAAPSRPGVPSAFVGASAMRASGPALHLEYVGGGMGAGFDFGDLRVHPDSPCVVWTRYAEQTAPPHVGGEPESTLTPFGLPAIALVSGTRADERVRFIERSLEANPCFGLDPPENCGYWVHRPAPGYVAMSLTLPFGDVLVLPASPDGNPADNYLQDLLDEAEREWDQRNPPLGNGPSGGGGRWEGGYLPRPLPGTAVFMDPAFDVGSKPLPAYQIQYRIPRPDGSAAPGTKQTIRYED